MTPSELRPLLARVVGELPTADLPSLIGVLAEAQATATAKLNTPTTLSTPTTTSMLSADQVAAALGVKASAVLEWARAGRIPVEKFGRFSRFDLAAVRAALAANSKTVRLGASKTPRPDGNLREPLTARLPRRGRRETAPEAARG